jgi:hypothetical protein
MKVTAYYRPNLSLVSFILGPLDEMRLTLLSHFDLLTRFVTRSVQQLELELLILPDLLCSHPSLLGLVFFCFLRFVNHYLSFVPLYFLLFFQLRFQISPLVSKSKKHVATHTQVTTDVNTEDPEELTVPAPIVAPIVLQIW